VAGFALVRPKRLHPRSRLATLAVGLSLSALVGPAGAQTSQPMTIAGLGTISFPTSTHSAAAESTFVRGVLLLHVFQYEDAAVAFRAAQQIDPGMALAYWGEAMTHTHPVWDEQDRAAGRAALAKLAATAAEREAKAATPRERGYLHAVDILYGDGPKARRDTLYSNAMAQLRSAYPQDGEARAFYALSLLGLSQGVREVPTYLHAAAIAESIFARNPKHPGAAHYWIHGMDDPDHAADALPAARALSEIAPDAGHAQHMTSHIFMALGMWDDVVRANENAMRVVNAAQHAAGRGPSFCGHYNFWLEYGYLQQGRLDEARALMQHCESQAQPAAGDPRDPDNSLLGSAVQMWARYVIDARAWSGDVVQWVPDFGNAVAPRATWEFTRGLAAAERGDISTARAALAGFERARTHLVAEIARAAEPDPGDAEYEKRLGVLALELQAEIQLAATPANSDSAVALLRRATKLEDSMAFAFGPPHVDMPSHELLGHVLLADQQFAEAEREFQAALHRTPGRVSVLEGLKRAQSEAHSH
jgi:tetratricopeptide (TPR) repeat protein